MEKAKDYCAYAASCGVIPLAPHTIFTQYLNDAVPEQREQGLRMGHELLERCDTISQGMKDEIGLATFLQLPILYVSDDMVKNVVHGTIQPDPHFSRYVLPVADGEPHLVFPIDGRCLPELST